MYFFAQYKLHRAKKNEDLRENAIDFLANLCDVIHAKCPNIRLKELLIGFSVANFGFLMPLAPTPG